MSARVLPATVFGTSFLDLTGTAQAGRGRIRAGDVIAQDQHPDAGAAEGLDSIDRLVDALGPAELTTALHAPGALDGRGEQLGQTIDLANKLPAPAPARDAAGPRGPPAAGHEPRDRPRNAPELLDAVDDALVAAHLVEQQGQSRRCSAAGSARRGRRHCSSPTTRTSWSASPSGRRRRRRRSTTTAAGLRHGRSTIGDNLSRKCQAVGDGQAAGRRHRRRADVWPYYTRADCPRYGPRRQLRRRAAVRLVAGSLRRVPR